MQFAQNGENLTETLKAMELENAIRTKCLAAVSE